ncbi:unknown protein [Seminavis robusta]|uniref:G-protein coupled receptors family 1 profile domain-containing protein n=1 Tax=Seminavis robusta TaxID=568900 RepID=A0A9N8DL87_9STRA|nr:unknown protein [Seminavis robusta]|eukprot:Sro141_g065870.1 n/a (733) ;mRNA; r:67424-69864
MNSTGGTMNPPPLDLYSDSQKMALAYVTYFVTLPSVFGSLTIIYVILHDRQQLRKSVYYRLMLGLSTMDAICSLGLFSFGSWAVPKGSHLAFNEQGNVTTCNIAGFFLIMLCCDMMYNAFLAMYHALVVKFQATEDFLAKWMEPFFHVIAIFLPMSFAVAGIAQENINPLFGLSGYCFYIDSPPKCADDKEIDCLRGEGFDPPKIAGVMIFFAFPFLAITVSMVLITVHVWTAERRLSRYAVRGSTNAAAQLTMTKATAKQGLLYIGSFFLAFIWSAIASLYKAPPIPENARTFFVLCFLAKFFGPLMGVFNVFIFLPSRYEKLSKPGECLHFVKQWTGRCQRRRAKNPLRETARTKSSVSENFAMNGNDETCRTATCREEQDSTKMILPETIDELDMEALDNERVGVDQDVVPKPPSSSKSVQGSTHSLTGGSFHKHTQHSLRSVQGRSNKHLSGDSFHTYTPHFAMNQNDETSRTATSWEEQDSSKMVLPLTIDEIDNESFHNEQVVVDQDVVPTPPSSLRSVQGRPNSLSGGSFHKYTRSLRSVLGRSNKKLNEGWFHKYTQHFAMHLKDETCQTAAPREEQEDAKMVLPVSSGEIDNELFNNEPTGVDQDVSLKMVLPVTYDVIDKETSGTFDNEPTGVDQNVSLKMVLPVTSDVIDNETSGNEPAGVDRKSFPKMLLPVTNDEIDKEAFRIVLPGVNRDMPPKMVLPVTNDGIDKEAFGNEPAGVDW